MIDSRMIIRSTLREGHMTIGRDRDDESAAWHHPPVISAGRLGRGSPSDLLPRVPALHMTFVQAAGRRNRQRWAVSDCSFQGPRSQEARHTGKEEAQTRATQHPVSDRLAKRASRDFCSMWELPRQADPEGQEMSTQQKQRQEPGRV